VVRREVVRLVTPGTLTEDSLLEARSHNFLAAWTEVRDSGALAWVDISTGEFRVAECPLTRLMPELARLNPRELLVPDAREEEFAGITSETAVSVTPLARANFDSTGAQDRLCRLFKVGTLEGFGTFGRAELGAMGAIVAYLDLTQRGRLPLLRPPHRESAGGAMQIDAATRRNLELTRSLSGGREGSLLATVDRTVTAGGARLLERRISSPSRELGEIRARLAAVSSLRENFDLRNALRDALRRVPDMDRALSRLALERGGPRDLAALRDGLAQGARIGERLASVEPPPLLAALPEALSGHDALCELLESALVAEPPLLARDGGFIAAGHEPELDEARALRDEGRAVIARMQAQYVEFTGIASLKIRHNNVLGYFVETTATHAERMLAPPLSETFRHRQTTANQLRFTTPELAELESKILNAGARALEIEKRLFAELAGAALEQSGPIGLAARALAEIDLAAALAELAETRDWCAPVVDDSRMFHVEQGRHPVVEAALQREGAPFVANDCALGGANGAGEAAIWLLTGPNMAGKSTFLRQNALIALLAQAGSHVPAARAHIGLVSQLFSRVGASDDLARGRSTFMVEMVETAAILNTADDRALVILDEIGRGTATWDGLSLAWATLEHLHDANRCRALFATHYHELTALAGKLPGVENATVAVKEWRGEVVFLHEVRKGAADRSYGVQVARLAGLPPAVVERAKVVLEALESGEREAGGRRRALVDDLPLFSAAAPATPAVAAKGPSAVEARLEDVHPDALTPREALALIYELREMLTDGD
jgi:DNA mismatch repair protein MutS